MRLGSESSRSGCRGALQARQGRDSTLFEASLREFEGRIAFEGLSRLWRPCSFVGPGWGGLALTAADRRGSYHRLKKTTATLKPDPPAAVLRASVRPDGGLSGWGTGG